MQISSNQGNSFFTVASENWNTSSTCNITVCNESDITNTLNSLKNNPNVLDVIQKLPILKKSCNFTEDLNNTYTYNEIQKKIIQNVMNMDFSGNNITVTTPEVAIVVYKMKITSTTPQEIDIAMPQMLNYRSILLSLKKTLSKNNNNTEKRVAVACFESADQFKTAAGEEVRSMVIQIEVVGETISGLKNPLTLNFPLYNKTDYNANYTETCKFYNSGAKRESVWSTDGCNTNKTNTTVICTCNHMTPFAVLMVPVGKISEPDWQILSVLSYIGCGLSAGFTAISVLTYFILRSPKRDHSYTIHVCLSAALYMLNMTFLLNEWLTSKAMSTLCTFIAVFMHYSLLSCFTWMAIEAVHLYLLMIKVFNTYIRHYISKLSVAGWVTGIPAVIVGISMALNGKYEIYGVLSTSLITSNASASTNRCWIMNQNFLYGVNIAYFGIIFLFNMGILITVAVKIGQLRRFGKSSDKGVLWKDMCTVTGLTCLLGTTWGLAFFGHGVFTTPVLYMFTIFNSLQGFFIFLWTCASSSKGVKTNDFKTKSSYAGCETSSIAKPKEVLFPELNSDPYK
uniref:Uncharacterized protein n=1 Tax=Lepisosteus oculatus TaxID=7918 RepID=W5MG00_LEPOC